MEETEETVIEEGGKLKIFLNPTLLQRLQILMCNVMYKGQQIVFRANEKLGIINVLKWRGMKFRNDDGPRIFPTSLRF